MVLLKYTRGGSRSCWLLLALAFMMPQVACSRSYPQWESGPAFALAYQLQTLRLVAVSPPEGATNQGIGSTSVSLTFSRSTLADSLTTNAQDTTCSGAVQLSADGFQTCAPLSAAEPSGGDGRTFLFRPVTALQSPSTYRIRIAPTVTARNAHLLGESWTSGQGFSTATSVFATQTSYSGNLGGVAGADAKCMADNNYPGTGSFRAMVVDGTQRSACASTTCNWVFRPLRSYFRLIDGTLILTTNADGITGGTQSAAFTGTGAQYWTGLSAAWGADVHCDNWSDETAGANGSVGSGNVTNANAYSGTVLPCNSTRPLLCVLQ